MFLEHKNKAKHSQHVPWDQKSKSGELKKNTNHSA